MKAVACLIGLCLLAVGVVNSNYAWEQGKQYRYQVRGRVMAGIAEINTQYAGLELKYVQLITVTAPNVLNVKIEDLKAIETNEELENGGFRDGKIQKGQEAQIPSELRHYLTAPMDMILEKGVVQSIKVPSDLPTWAVNIKKAQASTFILDTTGHGSQRLIVEGNLNRPQPQEQGQGQYQQGQYQRQQHANVVNQRDLDQNQESGFFYETLEESVHGQCETYYTVSQNGPFDAPFQFERQVPAAANTGSGSSSSESTEQVQGKYQSQSRIYKAYKAAIGASSSSSSESNEKSSKEQPWPRAFRQLCQQDDQVYEIIKTVNFTACAKKPVLAYTTPAAINFRPADNAGGSLWARALVSRIVACGQSRQNYTILKISQQERFHSGIQSYEKIVAGAQKNVTLISIGHGQATPVQNPKTINSLVYTFDPKQQELIKAGRLQTAAQMNSGSDSSEERLQSDAAYMNMNQQQKQQYRQQRGQFSYGSSSSEEKYGSTKSQRHQQYVSAYRTSAEGKGQLPQPSLEQAPLASMLITPLKRDQMKSRISELMQEIARDLTKSTEKDSIAEREVLSKISTVVKILRVLDAPEIQEVAQKWAQQSGNEQQEVARSIFVDALAIAGTNPTVVYLLKHIKSGQLNGEEAAQVLSSLPMYIRTPTRELLEKYYELIDDQQVKSQQQVRTTAMLSFSILLQNACINKQVKNTRYPVALYGEFCNEQYVAKKFVPFFVQALEKRLEQQQANSGSEQARHWVITLLAVLGNLGHPDTIEVVQKIMDEETDQFIKTKAIFALKNLIQSRSKLNQNRQQQYSQQGQKIVLPVDRQSRDILTDEVVEQQVLPLLVSVSFDRGEHPQVRCAAITLLLHCTYADVAIWQQLALSTWFEQSRQVHSFVYSSLKSLSQLQNPPKGIWTMQTKARAVLSLAKPLKASLARSHNLFSDEWVQGMNSGFAQQMTYYQGQDSIFPTHVYYRNYFNYGNGAAGVHPVEFAVTGNTIQKLANAFIKVVTQEGPWGQQGGERQGDRQAHQEMSEIHQLLNISPRKQDEPVQGSIYLKLRDEIERLWTFDDQTVQQLAQQLAQNVNAQGEFNVNYQKTCHMAEHLAAMPTIMGIPLVYNMRIPTLVSIRGTIKLNQQQGQQGQGQSNSYSVQADLAPVYSWKIHRKLSFKVPFTGKKYQAGVQRHFVVEAPFSAVARKASQGQLQLAITPAHLSRGAPSGTINLVTYHQIPYTAIITDEFYPTNAQQGGKMQIVHANEYKKDDVKKTTEFGQKTLGLAFELREQSEFPEEQESMSGWTKFIRRFHTVNCAFNAAWLGSPSVRFVKRQINLDIDKSQTKTLVFLLAAKRQRTTVARQLGSSEEASTEQEQLQQQQQQQQGQFGQSSSESQEGQNWYSAAQFGRYTQEQQQQRQQRRSLWNQKHRSGRYNQQQRSQQQQQQQWGSSSSSSSSESTESTRGQKQFRVRGHVLVLALLGKKAPLESLDELKSEIQKPLQKQSTSTVQYLFQVQADQGKLFSRFAMGEAANQAAESLPQSSRAFQAIREAVIEASNDKSQPKVCAELRLTLDTPKHASRHIVAIRRETLLAKDLSVKVQGKLQAGQNCRVMPLEVTVQGKMVRDQEMTEWARSKSPQAKKCNEDKKKGFTVSQICMDVAEQQAAALNKVQLHFQHTAMPKQIQNMTVTHIQNFLKAALYPYMSENQFPESTGVAHNSFEIRARMTPNKEFVSFEIRKPESILSFNDIKTGRVLKTLLPLTASQTVYDNIKDRLFRAQSNSMCAIEKNYVNTFDNVTFSFDQQVARGCQHVLAKDCSGKYPMAVLVKDLQQNQGRTVTVLLGAATKIQIIPQGGASRTQPRQAGQSKSQSSSSESTELNGQQQQTRGSSRMTVIVNGKTVQLPYLVPSTYQQQKYQQQQQQQGQQYNQQYNNQQEKNREPIAEVMEMPNGGVQLIARRVQVATDGARVIVYASNALRNRTCGICGDFNNEKVAEMRSPKDFPLSSGSLLVASYAFNKRGQQQGQQGQQGQSQEQFQGQQGQCQVDGQIQRLIRKEEKSGQQQDRHIPNIYQRGHQYQNQQQQRRQQQREARKQQQKYQKQQQRGFWNGQQDQYDQYDLSSESTESTRQFRLQNRQQFQNKLQNQYGSRHMSQQQKQQQQQAYFGRFQNSQSGSQERKSQRGQQGQQHIVNKQVYLTNPHNQQELCFTVNSLPKCAHGATATQETQREASVFCAPKSQEQTKEWKRQIEQGQYVDLARFAHQKQNQKLRVPVAQRCVRV